MDAIRALPGRQEAQLLRLLLRHVPRRDLLEPLPGQLPGDGARRPDRRERLHQQARGGAARAVGRLRARARPLLPGLRPGQDHLPVRRPGSVRGLRRAHRAGQHARHPGARLHRRSAAGQRGRHPQRHADHALQQGQLAAARAGAHRGEPGRRDDSCASSPTPRGATTSTGRSTRVPTATSRSAPSSRSTRTTSVTSSRPATTRGACSSTSGSTRATSRSPTRSGRSTTRTRYGGPFTASKSAPTVLEVATTYDPATPFRGAKRLATQLGNVRFLTMVGDGHTAYQNGSPTCIDSAILALHRDAGAARQGHGLHAGAAVRAAAAGGGDERAGRADRSTSSSFAALRKAIRLHAHR